MSAAARTGPAAARRLLRRAGLAECRPAHVIAAGTVFAVTAVTLVRPAGQPG